VSLVFALAAAGLAAALALVVSAIITGNTKGAAGNGPLALLPTVTPAAAPSVTVFVAALAGAIGLNVTYWVRLNIFQALVLNAAAAVPLLFFGHRALSTTFAANTLDILPVSVAAAAATGASVAEEASAPPASAAAAAAGAASVNASSEGQKKGDGVVERKKDGNKNKK